MGIDYRCAPTEVIEKAIKEGNFRHPELVAPKELVDCEGYKKLKHDVLRDYLCDNDYQDGKKSFHDYAEKFEYAINRVMHYAEKTGLKASDILDQFEKDRNYWYMNYYQESNQPEIKTDKVRVFENDEEFMKSVGKSGFRCPFCKGISTNPVVCDTHILISDGNKKKKECDWTAYGLFGTMGRGISVFFKNRLKVYKIFMPIAWEESNGLHHFIHTP